MFSDSKTIKLRYRGERFDGARLPLDMLSDLPAYRELLVAFAKEKWKARNPSRKRIPRGFEESLSFSLSTIEDGSAIPVLKWDRKQVQSSLEGFPDEIIEIIDESHRSIAAMFSDGSTGNLTSEKIKALNRFGSSLQLGECIELLDSDDANGKVVSFDLAKRKLLLTRGGANYQVRLTETARLAGFEATTNQQDQGFALVDSKFGRLRIPIDTKKIKAELDGSFLESVHVDLLLALDDKDNVRSIPEVFDISVVESEMDTSIQESLDRISNLLALQDGWHDGVGLKVSNRSAEVARDIVARQSELSPLFHIYPTLDGGLSFEFVLNNWDLSIEINVDGRIELCGVHINDKRILAAKVFERAGDDLDSELNALR